MYYQETNASLHSRSHSMPESAYYTRVGARSRRNIVSMMSYDAPLHWRLREPLTVDCSVEYDLGASAARIPKDSAPLLIIHPAYVSRTPSVKERRTPQNRSAPPVTRHASFVRRYPYEEDFRASMPDIRGGHQTGARACLKNRLEAAFADSGIPSSSAATVPMTSSDSSYSQDGGAAELNRTIRADSGIGSPTSSNSVTAESSTESSGSKKWRNGVSGLVTGFFCCSAVQPPPKNEVWSSHHHHHPHPHHSTQTSTPQPQSLHYRRQRLSLPSSSYTSSSSGSSVQNHRRFNNSNNNTAVANHRPMDCFHQKPGSSIHMQHLSQFYPPQNNSSSSIVHKQSVYRPSNNTATNGTTCQRCRLSNSSVDCRDGFCSSIWNKENLIRPIQI